MPMDPVVPPGVPVKLSITTPAAETAGAAGVIGTATTAARADHVHAMPSTFPPTGAAGGDLSGTFPNPTVANINTVPLGSATATAGNLLVGSGSQWVTKAVSGDATLAATGAMTLASTAVTPGSYTNANLTVDAKGRVTAASNGAASGLSVLYIANSYPICTNTVTQTSIVGTGSGSNTFAANTLTLGKNIRIRGYFIVSSTTSATLKFLLYLGGSTGLLNLPATATLTLPAGSVTGTVVLDYSFTIRSTGGVGTATAMGAGTINYGNGNVSPSALSAGGYIQASFNTFDTTVSNNIDLQVQWGAASASNSIQTMVLTIEALN